MRFKNYVQVHSLEEAYALNQKRSNRILGGTLWMRQRNGQFGTAIDLSALGLNEIEETGEEFRIGAMVTLRQLELHPGLEHFTNGSVRESVRHLVGVQFRNLATVGGSIFGRFGFSDVLTMFLALDTWVELYPSGIVSLAEFAASERTNEILVRILVKKHADTKCVYLSQRNTRTDFPVLTCAASEDERGARLVIGAAPSRAKVYELNGEIRDLLVQGRLTEETAAAEARRIAALVKTGSNIRGSAEYRTHLAGVLGRRALLALQKDMQKTADDAQMTGSSDAGDGAEETCLKENGTVVNIFRTGSRKSSTDGVSAPETEITLTLNGKKRTAAVPADQKLYDFLRENNCLSVKCGCDTSNCGLCTVLFDGAPVLSCSVLAVRADGHVIDTMEGLQKEAEEFGRFVALQGAEQCGFCNPGMIMNAIALFREIPEPTDEQIREYLAGNLCRCSGYEGQERAIREFMKFRKEQAKAGKETE